MTSDALTDVEFGGLVVEALEGLPEGPQENLAEFEITVLYERDADWAGRWVSALNLIAVNRWAWWRDRPRDVLIRQLQSVLLHELAHAMGSHHGQMPSGLEAAEVWAIGYGGA